MDLSNPWLLFSGAIIGIVGTALFIYGKRNEEYKCLGAGIALCVFPLFVHSLVLMWALAGLCIAGVYFLPRMD